MQRESGNTNRIYPAQSFSNNKDNSIAVYGQFFVICINRDEEQAETVIE